MNKFNICSNIKFDLLCLFALHASRIWKETEKFVSSFAKIKTKKIVTALRTILFHWDLFLIFQFTISQNRINSRQILVLTFLDVHRYFLHNTMSQDQ